MEVSVIDVHVRFILCDHVLCSCHDNLFLLESIAVKR